MDDDDDLMEEEEEVIEILYTAADGSTIRYKYTAPDGDMSTVCMHEEITEEDAKSMQHGDVHKHYGQGKTHYFLRHIFVDESTVEGHMDGQHDSFHVTLHVEDNGDLSFKSREHDDLFCKKDVHSAIHLFLCDKVYQVQRSMPAVWRARLAEFPHDLWHIKPRSGLDKWLGRKYRDDIWYRYSWVKLLDEPDYPEEDSPGEVDEEEEEEED